MLDLTQIISVNLILFSVIDFFGSVSIIIHLKRKVEYLQPEKATLVVRILMILFLIFRTNIFEPIWCRC